MSSVGSFCPSDRSHKYSMGSAVGLGVRAEVTLRVVVAEATLDRVLVAMTDVEAEAVLLTDPSGENSDVVCEAWKDRTITQIWMAKQYKRMRKAANDSTVLRHDLFARVLCRLYDDRSTSSPKKDFSLAPNGSAIEAPSPAAKGWLSDHARSY